MAGGPGLRKGTESSAVGKEERGNRETMGKDKGHRKGSLLRCRDVQFGWGESGPGWRGAGLGAGLMPRRKGRLQTQRSSAPGSELLG